MLSFKRYVKESEIWIGSHTDLEEALSRSLSRVHKHIEGGADGKGRNIGIISANTKKNTAEQNNTARKKLTKDIQKAGYGYAHVKGRGHEDDGVVDEPSILVIGAKGKKDGLEKHIKGWGRRYGQESVLHKHHNEKHATVHNTSDKKSAWPAPGESVKVGEFHANKASEYTTMLKGGDKKRVKRHFAFSENVDDKVKTVYTHAPSFFSRATTLF